MVIIINDTLQSSSLYILLVSSRVTVSVSECITHDSVTHSQVSDRLAS